MPLHRPQTRPPFHVGLALIVMASACSRRASDPSTELLRPKPEISAATVLASATSPTRNADEPPPSRAKPRHDVSSDFCIEAVDALDESACYVLPDAPTDELLIYLHGILPPSKTSRQKTNFQTVVKLASRRAKVAALLPRGRVGLAPKGHPGWWGWPTSRASYRALAAEITAELSAKRERLEELAGQRFRRVYLAGSSSGAYFVTALLAEQGVSADGYGIISGAADRPDVDFTTLPLRPVYIGFGTRDTVGGAARALGARLTKAGFPVAIAAHPLGHGAAEIYLDEAFAHFRAAGEP